MSTGFMPTTESVVRPHASHQQHRTTDRRVHYRAPLATPALIDAFAAYHRARCENVSVSGVALSCEAALPVGKSVEIYFELPSGVAIETKARVVRTGASLVALQFTALEPEAEVALRAHCHLARSIRP
jgi:hypothetical protein